MSKSDKTVSVNRSNRTNFGDNDHFKDVGHANDNTRQGRGAYTSYTKDKAKKLDKFYTNPDVAARCLTLAARFIAGHVLIEPAAGSGNMLDAAKAAGFKCHGFDIAPEADRPDIQTLDYLNGPIHDSLPGDVKDTPLATFTNPPFEKKGRLASKFANKALGESEYVCLILPRCATEWSFQSQIVPGARLLLSEPLPADSFTFCDKPCSVDCVFQIWTMLDVADDLRLNKAPKTKHPDFKMVRYNCVGDPSVLEMDWEFAVCAQAYGEAAGVRVERGGRLDPKKQWMLFTPKTEAARIILNGLDYKGLSWGTTAVKGFGKARIFTAYIKAIQAANDNAPITHSGGGS